MGTITSRSRQQARRVSAAAPGPSAHDTSSCGTITVEPAEDDREDDREDDDSSSGGGGTSRTLLAGGAGTVLLFLVYLLFG